MYRGINAVAAASAVFNSLRSASRSARLAVLELTSLESIGGLDSFDNLSTATLVSFAAWVATAARCCVPLAAVISLNLPRPVTKYTPTERIIKRKNKNAKAIRTRHFAFCSPDVLTNRSPRYLAIPAPCTVRGRTPPRVSLESVSPIGGLLQQRLKIALARWSASMPERVSVPSY